MEWIRYIGVLSVLLVGALGCTRSSTTPSSSAGSSPADRSVPMIVDTDANNELDDQHAIAYALLNEGAFDVRGITVNRTASGGPIENHLEEARRVVKLCGRSSDVPVRRGASGTFRAIAPELETDQYDGHDAVDFIIEQAHAVDDGPLVLLPIGKLTNIALALKKDPSIADDVRILWLGSNFPDAGEYNLRNDTSAVNPVIDSEALFEIAVVRYNRSSGTAAVQAFLPEIRERMSGAGPRVDTPVTGRHGGEFTTFGDYSVSLFEHVGQNARALYDVAAAALVKNPDWAERRTVGSYRLVDGQWVSRQSGDELVIWELFHTSKIVEDFYRTVERAGSDGG